MTDWIPIPEPVTWTLPAPIAHNGMSYATATLRAPTGADILKATAIPGAAGLDVTLRLIEAVSAEHVPYDALKTLPAYLVMQMGDYMDAFGETPAPDPLVAWRAARLAGALKDGAEAANGVAAQPPAI
jgi:hypothetical protein